MNDDSTDASSVGATNQATLEKARDFTMHQPLPPEFEDKSIKQIVGFLGDGRLRNNSDCSRELRTFLGMASPSQLKRHAVFCLENSFENSGFVLQDIVNEVGRRIGYEVEDGLYQGNRNDIGFDGVWRRGNDWIVVEVKTTDAYRINLDTVMGYVRRLERGASEEANISALIVAGRQDTGDLEAQIRGSKHAWSVRLISIDALFKLFFLNEELEDNQFSNKASLILRPFEYTRVDNIVELLFETQQETEKSITGDADEGEAAPTTEPTNEQNPSSRKEISEKREQIASSFYQKRNLDFTKRSQTNYESRDGRVGITCSVSKRYPRDSQPYWYALHPKWLEFLRSHEESYFVLACLDRDEAFFLPLDLIEEVLDDLNVTSNEKGHYWHVALYLDQSGHVKWNLSKAGRMIDLSQYSQNI